MRQSHVTRVPVRILLIEDNPGDARLIREMLVDGSTPFDLDWAPDLPEGLERLAEAPPDVALLDLSLPASVGLATFRTVFEHAPQIPIVVLTGLDDEALAVSSVQSGAQDYLVKGDVDSALLVRAVRYAIERKRAEEKLRSLVAELARARDAALQATRLKSAFLANMSHEIRTPLNMILGYNNLMAEDFAGLDRESREALLSGVQSAAQRLTTTIDGILDISKIETGNFELRPTLLDLPSLVAAQVAEFGHLAQAKGLTLACMIAEPRASILFDGYCLTHALMNLLQNAIKFTEVGGVSVILDRAADGRLRLSVRDSGIGIDPAFLPRLFEPFSQEETGYARRFEGSGLGLALTKQFLELNGATVSVESEKGKGAVFRIQLPPACEARRGAA